MNKIYLFICLAFGFAELGFAQCDLQKIDPAGMFVLADSEDRAHPIAAVLDGDASTYWRSNGNNPFPHIVEFALGDTYKLEQLTITPRQDNNEGKLAGYDVYANLDGSQLAPEAIGTIRYDSLEDRTAKTITFGAIEASFLTIVAVSNADRSNRHRLMISEIEVFERPCADIGRLNQTIRFAAPLKQLTTNTDFLPQMLSSSGLTPIIEVLSGPAEVQNGALTFTGTEGEVSIRAYHEGNDDFYPTEAFHSFPVIDASLYEPVLSTRLTETYPVEMPELMPYLLSATSNIEHDDVLAISAVEFDIEGEIYEGEAVRKGHQVWWQPDSYGDYRVTITTYASNGLTATETRLITVSEPIGENKTLQPLDKDLILFGGENSRWLYKTVTFPQFVGSYEKVLADFWTTCPQVTGGCDDWDRKAWIDVKGPDGNWIEIIRYITPYGRGCSHSLDLTDYASILQGEVELRMFIDTWGTGGWDVHLRLNYEAGTPDYTYAHVEPLWDGTFDFGNPSNRQPLDTLQYQFPIDARTAKLKVSTTGHGWGANNSQNSAEFYAATHFFNVNGVRTFNQSLFVDCNPNPDGCQPQSGTWQHSRAGWCPGAIAEIYEYNFTPYINQENIELSYIFDQRYVDNCHPNNPACVSGVTCSNCNDGFNPHYEIAANMIVYGESPVVSSVKAVNANDLGLRVFPNPAQDYFTLNIDDSLEQIQLRLQTVDGRLLQSHQFEQARALKAERFDIKSLPAGVYFVQILSEGKSAGIKLIKK